MDRPRFLAFPFQRCNHAAMYPVCLSVQGVIFIRQCGNQPCVFAKSKFFHVSAAHYNCDIIVIFQLFSSLCTLYRSSGEIYLDIFIVLYSVCFLFQIGLQFRKGIILITHNGCGWICGDSYRAGAESDSGDGWGIGERTMGYGGPVSRGQRNATSFRGAGGWVPVWKAKWGKTPETFWFITKNLWVSKHHLTCR